jgi:hypothetical protein
MTKEDERYLARLYHQYGPNWALIATFFPGRENNQVSSKWNAMQRKETLKIRNVSSPPGRSVSLPTIANISVQHPPIVVNNPVIFSPTTAVNANNFCTITQTFPQKPSQLDCGHVFEENALIGWGLSGHTKFPNCRSPMKIKGQDKHTTRSA